MSMKRSTWNDINIWVEDSRRFTSPQEFDGMKCHLICHNKISIIAKMRINSIFSCLFWGGIAVGIVSNEWNVLDMGAAFDEL